MGRVGRNRSLRDLFLPATPIPIEPEWNDTFGLIKILWYLLQPLLQRKADSFSAIANT